MSVSLPELKALLLKSGNRCAFPGCGSVLFQSGDDIESVVNRSEIAHIVAQSPDGPRGQYPLPMEERDNESNLILLCEEDHHRIDSKPQYYTVERLRQIKEDHEARIQEATGKAVLGQGKSQQRQQYVKETVYSTLFNVRLPNYAYGAVCRYADASHEEIRQLIVPPADPTEIYPYIIQGKELYAFQDLRHSNDLLGEVNFWRDFLGDSSPRIAMNYGQGQCVIISTEMMPTEIEWPGIPEQYAKPFKNVEYAETLFTWAEVANLESDIDSSSDDNEDEDWEEGDEDGE